MVSGLSARGLKELRGNVAPQYAEDFQRFNFLLESFRNFFGRRPGECAVNEKLDYLADVKFIVIREAVVSLDFFGL